MKFEDKIVGYEVDVAVLVTTVREEIKTFHFKGTCRAAERKAMLKPCAVRVIASRPLTDEQWVKAYGLQQRM